MKSFEEAARKAAEVVIISRSRGEAAERIASVYAPLAATHEKLVELAKVCDTMREAGHLLQNGYETSLAVQQTFSRSVEEISELVVAPLIIDAIKEGGE